MIITDWSPLEDLDITPDVTAIYVDTRDFHCFTAHISPKPLYGRKYLIPETQIKDWLLNLQDMTGGKGDWRMMNFRGIDANGWFKYIRLYREGSDFIVCDRGGHSVDWSLMTEENLIKEHLNFMKD